MFAVLVRFAQAMHLQSYEFMVAIFSTVAILSMIVGNVLALQQENIKRLLAYSSIAHFGYLLVAFWPGNGAGIEASIFYLFAYSVTILSAFGIITMLSTKQRDADKLKFTADYSGAIQ